MSRKNTNALTAGIAYTIGNVLLKGMNFLTLPIFSRLLTTEEFGLFNVYVSYETILTIFSGCCLYGSLRTAKYDYAEVFNKYIYHVLALSFIPFCGLLLINNLFYDFYATFFEFDRIISNILILHSYAMFLFQFLNVKLALNFEYKKYLCASALNSIFGTLISICLIIYFNDNKHIARIYGYAASPIIIAIVIWIILTKEGFICKWKRYDKEHWKYAFSISFPLVIHTLSQQILNQFDRIMIIKMVNAASAGIYSFVYTFSNILQIIVQSMDSAWSVWFYNQLNEKRYKEIESKAVAYILLMSILYIGFIGIAPDLMYIIAVEEYYSGFSMLVPLSFAVYFNFLYSLPVHVEYFYKKTKFIATGTSITAILNLILNLICIHQWGYLAAAWTTLLSYIVLYLFHQFIAKKIDKMVSFPFKTIAFNVFSLSVYSFIIIWIINRSILRWSAMLLMLMIIIIVYRKYISEIIEFTPIKKLRKDK